MLPAANTGAGMNIGFPDVCQVPAVPAPIPIPFVNLGMNAQALNASKKVRLTKLPALNMGSQLAMTMGMAGTPMLGPGKYTMGNPVVLIENLPGICLGCLTTGNNMNNALGLTAVPSVTNVMYTYAAPPLDLAALTRSLARVGRAGGPSVEGALAAPGVGYLVIRVFSADVPARVFSEVRALQAQGLEALIVDLRDNPGGEVNACLELLGDFLDEGSELVTMIDADGDETVIRSHGSPRYRLPVGILVNRGTASAAEIFAGCLQAHGRAMVAGEATYGKDVGQVVVATQEGAVMATVARYRLPGGGEVRVATRREAPYV